jgi:hypothetical protein
MELDLDRFKHHEQNTFIYNVIFFWYKEEEEGEIETHDFYVTWGRLHHPDKPRYSSPWFFLSLSRRANNGN